MKLYEIPRNSIFKLVGEPEEFYFHHLDGAYSYCTDSEGNVIHITGYAEVEVIG